MPEAEPEPGVADELARRILLSAKYRDLDELFVRRIANEAAQRFRDRNQALRYAKRKLHQAFGAFLSGSPARTVAEMVDAVCAGGVDLRVAAVEAMRTHASSAERVEWLVPLYEQVAAWCGAPRSVVDLACGLNPLAIPWMALAPDATYWCCEVDARLVASLAGLNRIMPARITSAACDLVASPPPLCADVALTLKTATTLEQQSAGAARQVLVALDCGHVILSLPRRSLSGRRGYGDDARAMLRAVIAGTSYRLDDEAAFGDELVFHLVQHAETQHRRERGASLRAPQSTPKEHREPGEERESGILTLVGTPIGNLGDLTDRALTALRAADVICAEDTRRTRKLLSAYEIHPRQLASVREHNENAQAEHVLRWLAEGQRVAYVTDAGMPVLSDPGQRLARRVLDAGGQVAVAPGPDAATAALLVAGVPAGRWCFEGFLPVKGAQRTRRLAAIAAEDRTVVLFEAPHRLRRSIDDLISVVGAERPVAVVNDLTKRFERVWRGSFGSVAAELAGVDPRGEFVLVIAAA